MKAIQLKSHVGADGVLNLSVPTDIRDRDLDVIVVIDPGSRAGAGTADSEQWAEFIRSTACSIPDPTFIRHEQGTLESRDELP